MVPHQPEFSITNFHIQKSVNQKVICKKSFKPNIMSFPIQLNDCMSYERYYIYINIYNTFAKVKSCVKL